MVKALGMVIGKLLNIRQKMIISPPLSQATVPAQHTSHWSHFGTRNPIQGVFRLSNLPTIFIARDGTLKRHCDLGQTPQELRGGRLAVRTLTNGHEV